MNFFHKLPDYLTNYDIKLNYQITFYKQSVY